MSEALFAVIGHPIGHTMSPFIHRRLFEIAHRSGEYTVVDIPPEALAVRMKELNRLTGYNITIPHKQRIIPFLDCLDEKAALYGAVNTVHNGDRRKGYTTDPDGFLKALRHNGVPLAGRVVIIGCGGAARTFAYEAALAGCAVTIAVRPSGAAKQQALVREMAEKLNGVSVQSVLTEELSGDIDLLINATPVGMYPHTADKPVSDQVLSRCANVFDAVYNPLHTTLLRAARANGARTADGMAMLVGQAAAAHAIWDGSRYTDDDIDQLIEDSAKEQQRCFS